jgi:hypothetical protein
VNVEEFVAVFGFSLVQEVDDRAFESIASIALGARYLHERDGAYWQNSSQSLKLYRIILGTIHVGAVCAAL